MARNTKTRYEIDLSMVRSQEVPKAMTLRTLEPSDKEALAQLMLDAYVGTIDYEGETLIEAIGEVDSWLAESPLLAHSYGALSDEVLVSAILVMELEGDPFISIVMTHPSAKRKGYGRSVAQATLESLRDAGNSRVVFYITDGNTASEKLFTRLGAHSVEGPE